VGEVRRGPAWQVAAALLATVLLAGAAWADLNRPPLLSQVGIEQRLNERLPLDLPFRDETGTEVVLRDYFGRRPVILTLVYYECPMLCTLVLNGLVRALKVLSFEPGREFEIVTVSFDPGETPALAAAKKETYLEQYGRAGAGGGWHFLTGTPESIEGLAQAVGFRYAYDAGRDEYAHAAAIMVATPQGRLARYFFGVEYSPRDLRLGLIEASQERIGTLVDTLLLYCFHYDPSTGRYSAVAMNIVRLGGALTVLALAGFIAVMRRRESRASAVGSTLAGPRPGYEHREIAP
jgi:protein SCO1/2